MADEIATSIERFGTIKFKMIAYKTLDKIIKSGAIGVEIRLSGKLPSERAKSHRFAYGFLKKTGDTAKIVNNAEARADTNLGTTGIKVSILQPDVMIHDQIHVNQKMMDKIKINDGLSQEKIEQKPIRRKKKNGSAKN